MLIFRSESTLVFSLHTKGITTQGRATISVIISIHYFKEIFTILTIVSFSFFSREVPVFGRPCSGTDDCR